MNMANSTETVSAQQPVMETEALPGTSISTLFLRTNSPLQTTVPSVTAKKPIPRLKQMTYGEVLTSDDVLNRLKEAEALKKAKQTPKPKRKTTTAVKNPRPIKKRNISTSSEEPENEKKYCV